MPTRRFWNRFRHRLTWRGPDGERGALLVVASIATVAALSATALAVDISKAVSTKRSLQTVVDLAALDGVRAVGDLHGQGNGLTPEQHALQLVRESLQRNDFDTDDPALGNTFSVVLGAYDPATRIFDSTADVTTHNAVQVEAHTTRDWAFMPGGRAYSANGVAAVRSEAGIAVGSYLARVDTSGGLLGSLFGAFLGGNVTLVGYTGLAAGHVTLGELRSELGVGTVDELLDTSMTLPELFGLMITALERRGDTASVQAATDLANLAVAANSSLALKLGDLIDVAQGADDAAATAQLNVLQLAQMAAQVANGQNAVSATLSTGSLGALGGLLGGSGNTIQLKIIEPPQIAIGPARQDGSGGWVTTARTAQVRAQINLRPLGTVLGGTLNLPIYVEAASATASLTAINCASPVEDSTVTVHTDTQAVRARVGTVNNINHASPTVSDAVILNVPLVARVTGKADVNVASAAGDLTFTGPFDWSNTATAGSTTLGLGTLTKNNLNLSLQILGLGIGLGDVLGAVLAILNPILDVVDAGLLDPLLAALGVSLGGGDVTAWKVDCAARNLVG